MTTYTPNFPPNLSIIKTDSIESITDMMDPHVGDEHSAQAAAERIRHAGMTGVSLVRAVSKIAQLSPMGEPLARILGVTIDPYVV